ncbi:hypothetical protein C8F01DRAFT_668908 [Mycena amicta]|nr:hypothetical protein C8F01DRAFT_668908 [Mycena amicta]
MSIPETRLRRFARASRLISVPLVLPSEYEASRTTRGMIRAIRRPSTTTSRARPIEDVRCRWTVHGYLGPHHKPKPHRLRFIVGGRGTVVCIRCPKTRLTWRCDHATITQLESYRHDSMRFSTPIEPKGRGITRWRRRLRSFGSGDLRLYWMCRPRS